MIRFSPPAVFLLIVVVIFPARAEEGLAHYTPPAMFGSTVEEAQTFRLVNPPLPPRRPKTFFASKAYIKKLAIQARKAGMKKPGRISNLNAREVLASIEEE